MNSFVVSIECPLCGAPLDFSEGSNAVQCLHCKATLLVTGRKKVLSYYIDPRIDVHLAVAAAMAELKNRGMEGCRVVNPSLYFVPYYRLTGQDLRWEKPVPKKEDREEDGPELAGPGPGTPAEASFSLFAGLVGKFFNDETLRDTIPDILSAGKGLSSGHPVFNGVQLNDRYIEKNFIACNLGGSGLYSIGVRATVLKLKAFNLGSLNSLGKIVAPDISPENALVRGLRSDVDGELVYRTVMGRILSVIYFPFWAVEIERKGEGMISIVDAVSKSIIKSEAPSSLKGLLDREVQKGQKTAGFRPLVCPNCGWDLPVRPDDAIFICPSCNKGWQIYGDLFHETDYRIGELNNPGLKGNVRYLPFWVIQAEKEGKPFELFLPAFRYRRLKALSDLASRITTKQPVCRFSENGKDKVNTEAFEGCYYDQEDAALLACFVNAGLEMKKGNGKIGPETLRMKGAVLTWFPFAINGASLVDPFTGTYLTRALFCS